MVAADPDNVVRIVLPEPDDVAGADPYVAAAALLDAWVSDGVLHVDPEPTPLRLRDAHRAGRRRECPPRSAGSVTRGLLGAVELRDPEDGVILPHENTMAGPVADRLALMEATEANLEPIYLVYDGGGAASALVASVRDADEQTPAAAFVTSAVTPDGTHHRLWAVTDPAVLADVAADLSGRSALIADGHHRYATYRQLAARRRSTTALGPGTEDLPCWWTVPPTAPRYTPSTG